MKFVDEQEGEHLSSRHRDIENDFDETVDSSYNKSVQLNLSYHDNNQNNSKYSTDVVVNTNTIQKLGNFIGYSSFKSISLNFDTNLIS